MSFTQMKTYLFLLGSHHLRPAILFICLWRSVSGAMLLQTPLHAIYGAPANLQTTVNGGRVYAGLEELNDLLLHIGILLATARHACVLRRVEL